MQLIKRKSSKIYVNSETKKECHYYNYYLETDNGKRVLIKPVKVEDFARLDMVAKLEK